MGNFVEIGSLVCRILSNIFLSHSQYDIMDVCGRQKISLHGICRGAGRLDEQTTCILSIVRMVFTSFHFIAFYSNKFRKLMECNARSGRIRFRTLTFGADIRFVLAIILQSTEFSRLSFVHGLIKR